MSDEALSWRTVFNADLLPYQCRTQAARAARSAGYEWFAFKGRLYMIMTDGSWGDTTLSMASFDGDNAIAALKDLVERRQRKIKEMAVGHARMDARIHELEERLNVAVSFPG